MVVLDDCQWADELTIKLIGQWLANRHHPSPDGHHVLSGGRVPNGGGSRGPSAAQARAGAAFDALTRSSPTTCGVWRSRWRGRLPDEAVNVVVGLSEGCPFMTSAMLRGMVESGVLVAEPNGWRVEPLALADLHSSNWAAGVLSRRIELLPQATIDLLVVGRGAGKGIRPAVGRGDRPAAGFARRPRC